MPRVVYIANIFEQYKREILDCPVGVPVASVLPPTLDYAQCHCVHLGKAEQIDLKTFCFTREHDELVVRVVPGFVTAAIFGYTAAQIAAGAVSTWATIGVAAINMAIAAAVSIGVSAIVRALLPTPKGESKVSDEGPSYGWDGVQNTTANGTPIALLYGRHRIGGQVLSAFTRSKSDGRNELSMQIGLCAGPVSAINGKVADADDLTGASIGDDLKINNNAASVFDELKVSYRRGEWDQAVVPGFDNTITQIAQSTEITSSAYTYTTSDECQAVELQMRCPSGLYRLTDRGGLRQYEVQYRVRYRQYGAGSYGAWETVTLSAMTRSQYNATHEIVFSAPSKYELEIERVTAADGTYTISTLYLIGVSEINRDDVAYNGIATVSLKAIAAEDLNGSIPTVTSLVHGKKVVVYRPSDDFGEDTQQTFSADGEALWGWYADNIANVSSMASHGWGERMLSILHTAANLTQNDGTACSGPEAYKKITGDFDLRVRVASAGTNIALSEAGIVIRSTSDPDTVWHAVLQHRDSGNTGWEVLRTGCVAGSYSVGHTDSSCSDEYLRLARTGSTIAAYHSADGVTWTLMDSVTRSDLTGEVRLGFYVASPSAAPSMLRYNFMSMEFTDSTAYSTECSRNPAWIIYDLLTDSHYGLGAHIDATEPDLDAFIAFADYCSELVSNGASGYHRRHCLDVIIDSSSSAWDRIQELARCARASLVLQADAIRPVFQAAADAVQLFSVANIKRGTFGLSYQSPKTSANAWETQYLNEDLDYEQDYESFVDPDIDVGEPYRAQTTTMYGITRRAHALREARFLCRANRLLTTVCSFETGIDALACEPGDRIEVQFDTPAWGEGGRVVAATANTITFDQPITLEAGTTYEVLVRHADDTLETRTISTSAGTYTTVAIAPDWTATPAASELYAVGEENIATRPFLVTSIERTNELECRIECVEYDATLYDDTLADLGEITYTSLPDPREIPDNVSGLVVTERAQIEKDGAIKNVLDVTFTFPVDAVEAQVYWRENGLTNWIYVGSTRSTHYVIDSNVVYGTTYDVAVASVSAWGLHRAPDLCPSTTLTVQGRTTAPSNVTGLSVTRVGDQIAFRWTAVTDPDLAGYEIRYGTSAWESAQIVASGITGTEYSTPNFSQGTAYYLIKAYNTSGIYSATAGFVNQTIEGRIAENLVIERDEGTEGWDGTKTDMTVDGTDLDLDSGHTTGTYETPELDCGASVRSLVACLVQVAQIDLSLTWAGATWTWGSATAAATTWSGSGTSHLTMTVQFRYGDTSGALGSYQTFVPGEYSARYYQFRVTVTLDSSSYSATIEQMLTTIDVPDYVISGKAVAIAATGTTTITWTTYGNGFNIAPKFVAVPDAGGAGDNIEIVSVSATAATVRYWNGAGTQVAGACNFLAQGY